jgi:hypothetical protein
MAVKSNRCALPSQGVYAGDTLVKPKIKLDKRLTNTWWSFILRDVKSRKLPAPTKAIRECDDLKEAAR